VKKQNLPYLKNVNEEGGRDGGVVAMRGVASINGVSSKKCTQEKEVTNFRTKVYFGLKDISVV
jgi:hypothetical protein